MKTMRDAINKIIEQKKKIDQLTESNKIKSINLQKNALELEFLAKRIKQKMGSQFWIDIQNSIENPRKFSQDDFLQLQEQRRKKAQAIQKREEEFKKAKEVINYYANQENWDFQEIDKSDVEFCEDAQADLGGKRAREFLKKLEE